MIGLCVFVCVKIEEKSKNPIPLRGAKCVCEVGFHGMQRGEWGFTN